MTPSAISLAGLVKSQVVKGRRGADSGRIIHILQGNLVSRLGQGQLVAQIIGHGEDMVLFFLQYQLIGYGIVYGLAGNAQDSALLLGKGLACGIFTPAFPRTWRKLRRALSMVSPVPTLV